MNRFVLLVPDRKSFYSFDGADFVESEAIRRRQLGYIVETEHKAGRQKMLIKT